MWAKNWQTSCKRHEMKTPHVKTSVVETFQFKFIVRVLSAIVWQVGARP